MNINARILKISLVVFAITSLFITLFAFVIFSIFFDNHSKKSNFREEFSDLQSDTLSAEDAFASDSHTFTAMLDSLDAVNSIRAANLSGGRISISICGVDSRVGTHTKHADANHLVNIWLDSAVIEIVSIPRGTYSDVGYHDTSGLNYLANYRAARGRDPYLKEIERISGTQGINNYVEFGFSQAIGLLELLGYKQSAVQTLRVLRSRKGFSTGDYQRSYNQGQFIRQMILKNFNRLDGLFGELVLRGAVILVESNLTYADLNKIMLKLRAKGFPRSANDVFVRLAPKFTSRLSNFNFSDERLLDSLYKSIAKKTYDSSETDKNLYDSKSISNRISKRLFAAIKSAESDTARRPAAVVSRLKGIFEQRAWFQVADSAQRDSIRKNICKLLEKSYTKLGNAIEARRIKLYMEAEDLFFRKKR